MEENIKKPKPIKIGFIGDSRVGKTIIINCYFGQEFERDSIATIGVIKSETKCKFKNNEERKVILWDTSGVERCRAVVFSVLKTVQGIILIFDVTIRASFDNLDMWIKTAYEKINNPIFIYFIR